MKSIGYLVTVFNEQKTVRQSIQQVLDINYPNKKILVIDNGSTDNCGIANLSLDHDLLSRLTMT